MSANSLQCTKATVLILSNYRPISHLFFLSKFTERVKNRLTSDLSTNDLLNSYQVTESTLLVVHDHISKSTSEQKCHLDLSATFDTIDHSILLHRLSSWFGFDGQSYFLANFLFITSEHFGALLFLSAIFPLLTLPLVKVFHKDQSLVLSYSYCTLYTSHSVLLSLIRLSVIIYLLMTLNCSSPSGHLNSPPIFYT